MVFLRRIITLLLSSFLMIILMGCASNRPFEYLNLSPSIPTPKKTPAPSKTRIPISPTQRPVIKTLTPSNSCHRWDEITIDMEDDGVCVYGEVVEKYIWNESTRLNFSKEQDTFFIQTDNQDFLLIESGDCIQATGIVIVWDKFVYLEVDKVANCADQ